MPRKQALSGTGLDWDRELCNQGCREWVPWYQGKKGQTVRGCRLGLIPRRDAGGWTCRQRKPTKQKEVTHA